jgi:hypothetical protein
MEYNLDNRVVLSTKREHKNLYPWSIKEYDKSGKQIGGDQIPWDWSLNFEAVELARSLEIREDGLVGEESKINVSERLYGKLLPSVQSREAGYYSMFGTQRQIKQFHLFIFRATSSEKESCYVWGSASYTSDLDFEDVTEPDCLQINVSLSSEKFDQVMDFVKSPHGATGVAIRLSGVSGFYSDWSPSIRTDSIKVLANTQDQKLENPENLAVDPPTLGHVQNFQISVRQNLLK